jgi:nucleoside-diphosphate-sugar epimerase
MNVTLLGASGYIGKNLLAHLRNSGHDVCTPPINEKLFSRSLGRVIYCIGVTADFRDRPYDTMRAHIGVLTDVLERSTFDSFLYLSSTRVYARNRITSETEALIIDPSDLSDLYNISKLAGESLCRACKRNDVKIARLSNVIGPDLTSQNFVFDLIRQSINGRVVLQSSPFSSKDYIWIDDVVALLAQIVAFGTEAIYNVASGSNLRHNEILDQLVHLTGTQIDATMGAPLHVFPVIDTQRIRREFGFSPQGMLDKLPNLIELFSNLQYSEIEKDIT